MTVRWKPLLILSGLFVVVALAGLMTIATVMGSRGSADILARARASRKAGQYPNAELDFKRALAIDARGSAIHDEMADLYDEWARKAPADKKAELRGLRVASLNKSIKANTRRAEPRRKLLADALRQDDAIEQVRQAKELVTIEPDNDDAHYALAADELEATSPNLPEIRGHLKAQEARPPRRARAEWVAAKLASLANDPTRLEQVLARARALELPAEADPVDRMALLKLRVLDVQNSPDPAALAGKVEAVTKDAMAASADPDIPSTRIARIGMLIEDVQKGLDQMAAATPSARVRLKEYGDTLDQAAEAIFQKSLSVKVGGDLSVYLAYADHLRFRDKRGQCLEVVTQGLKSPAAAKQGATETAMGLHALAVEAILANFGDKARYDSASPHIKTLLDCKHERFQALGHLFQGAIDLERAGMVADAQAPEVPAAEQARLRASALGHLKIAATQLPHLAESQARYGVALILNQEPAMGRQYLQAAQRLGNLEPQYQVWAAWSVVQAGYPEDAEPIVASMLKAIKEGKLPPALEGTLHLLNGEIHQSRKSPSDLRKAIDEYRLAFANGQDATPAVEMRLAQIEVMLGRPADALKRIDWLANRGKAGPSAEDLAVLTLIEQGKVDDARKRLDEARVRYPDSSELAILDASLQLKAKQAAKADAILAEFLVKSPDNIPVVQQRATILSRDLGKPAEARKLLGSVADRAENSAPLVQLALLEVDLKDYEAVAATIAKIRNRWKDAAAGDLLDAQLSLARGDEAGALVHFDAALKKDPNNKVVQFYKARLDARTDPDGASKVFEVLAKDNSTKEVDSGLSLVAASKTALAGLAVESGDLDSAVSRYREMLKANNPPALTRAIRWRLASALASKKEWPAAKVEIESLLNDPNSPPSAEDRDRAATFYRLNKEDGPALKLVDLVLKADPSDAPAAVTRAEILARAKDHAGSIACLRKAIEATDAGGRKVPDALYLMMAAVESTAPPTAQGMDRALRTLDEGLAKLPDSVDLVKAKSRVLTATQGAKAGSNFVEEKAKADPKGPFRRLLLTTYRDQGDYASAERVAAEIAKDDPTDAAMVAAQVRMVVAQAVDAARKGDAAGSRRLDERAAALIADGRGRFKADPAFIQLDCEREIRRGDSTRALALSQEVDAMAKGSPAGPLLRAQVFAGKNQPREAAHAYAEALGRNPRLPEARLQLARLSLKTGQVDEAIRQARFLQDADPDKPIGMAALLVEARAMAAQTGTKAQVQANRSKAIARLADAARLRPEFVEANYLIAEIHLINDDRPRALGTLKDILKANPDDATALTMAVQSLVEPRAKGKPAPQADLDAAAALARAFGDADPKGGRLMAVSAGYAKAGRPDLALPWAEKAATKLDNAGARLALGDLLLTMSEAQVDSTKARKLLDRALAEYDAVLASQPDLVDAVNNKAWILHSYLGQSQAALELAQGLLRRVDPTLLPGEFYDTLGSIQEELAQPRDAEESYKKGLGKSPEHPVLNYHMGRLMLADKDRSRKAADFLKVAEAGRDKLPAAMADNLNSLLRKLQAN